MLSLCAYEIRIQAYTLATTFGLFVLYAFSFPLLLACSQDLLVSFKLSLLWLSMLFTFLPERGFQSDLIDGSLEVYLLSTRSFLRILVSKLIGFWLLKLGGILFSLPIVYIFYPVDSLTSLTVSMVLGSLGFTLIWGVHSCLTLSCSDKAWSGVQQLTAFPSLLPLILLCNLHGHVWLLAGYLCVYVFIYASMVPVILRQLIAH